jgi:hypothetical protein
MFFEIRDFFRNFREKLSIFNIESISYCVSLQYDIRQKLLGKHASYP